MTEWPVVQHFVELVVDCHVPNFHRDASDLAERYYCVD